MDGTRLWRGGERGGGGERSNWRVIVDEDEGALDWAEGGRRGDEGSARAADGRGWRRRKVEDFFGEAGMRGGSGVEEAEGEGESSWVCIPSPARGMSGCGCGGGGDVTGDVRGSSLTGWTGSMSEGSFSVIQSPETGREEGGGTLGGMGKDDAVREWRLD